ncbi:MAG: hypothetical protein IJJ23_06070 [Clostridia bacterium]|nr:hypothetical protein [Clostridia bacterium]
MQSAIREYDAHLDAKHRITLRHAPYEYYHIAEMEDGRIILEPRVLTAPFEVSARTLNMMDESIRSMKEGKVSEAIDLSEFEG